MKIASIINQLASELPNYDDRFADVTDITTLETSGTLATAVTATNHNLTTGTYVLITGTIDVSQIVSLELSNGIVTGRTATDHGLDMAMNYKTLTAKNPPPQVEIIGADQAIFNGTFDLRSTPNRTAFTFKLNEPDQIATGVDIRSFKYNSYRFFGAKQVTVIDPTTFTFAVDAGYDGFIGGDNKKVQANVRVSGAVNLDRAQASYTAQNPNKYWAIVLGGTTTSSKDRNILNDAVAAQSQNSEYRIRLIEDFDIAIFIPTAKEISGRLAFDNFEDVKVNVLNSTLGFSVTSQYNSDENFQLTFVSSEIVYYDTTYMIGVIRLQTLQDVTYGDTIRRRSFFPARDIDYTMDIDVESGNADDLLFTIDLDDDPDF